MTDVLNEAKRLHALGFAILWIRPKAKNPVKSGWTTGARQSWQELVESYVDGYNIGVRTGTPSYIEGRGYLACIDVDIKDPSCREPALSKAREVYGDAVCWEVSSGGGNGSCHLYCLTSQPFKMLTIAKEKGWEICIYSDGRQMVLPPSIHPSGRKYQWKKHDQELPLLDFSAYAKEKASCTDSKNDCRQDFVIDETLDVRWLPDLSDEIRDAIVRGTGVTDRSGYMLKACNALMSAGLSREDILTVMTDPILYLGKTAYDHAKTNSRQRAAQWVWDYTLRRIMEERDPSLGSPIENELDQWEADLQSERLRDKPEERGFYKPGKNGALQPEYDSLLEYFQETHDFKSIADMKTVFVFKDTHYVDFTPTELKGFAEQHFKPRPLEKTRQEFVSKVFANNICRRSFFTESTEGKINFRNGVLDLNESEELKEHSGEYGFRGVLPYDYEPFASCPVFLKWLNDIMLGDEKLIAILQEYMGYIVRGGDYKYHKALWLGGVGRNGKSTFVDLLKALIGIRNFSVISIKSLMNDKFAGSELDGKIANFSEETSPEELKDSGPFKNLTGDGDISAQKKFGDLYQFRNKAKLVMTYNQIPDLKDLSPGMLSRPIIIPFEKIIAEGTQDRTIKGRLLKELPGIFNFALEGWKRLEEQGDFTESEKSQLALQRIKEESCNVYQWVEEHVQFHERNFNNKEMRYTPQRLYGFYKTHERYPFRNVEFYRRLHQHPKMKNHFKRKEDGRIYFSIEIR